MRFWSKGSVSKGLFPVWEGVQPQSYLHDLESWRRTGPEGMVDAAESLSLFWFLSECNSFHLRALLCITQRDHSVPFPVFSSEIRTQVMHNENQTFDLTTWLQG